MASSPSPSSSPFPSPLPSSGSHSAAEALNLLKTSSISVLPPSPSILHLDSEEIVESAFNKLIEKNVRSAPVFDQKTQSYIGLLDFIDLLSFLIKLIDENKHVEIPTLKDKFFQHPVRDLPNLSGRNKLEIVTINSSIYDVMTKLGQGCRRVVVQDENKHISHIVSQSAVVQFIAKNHTIFESSLLRKVEDKVTNTPLIKCDSGGEDEVSRSPTALDAFKLMSTNNISAVPVVRDRKTLISSITSRDLKLLFAEQSLDALLIPVEDYIARVRCLNVQTEGFPYIVVDLGASYDKALLKLAATKVQRLYIINSDKIPVGVLTLKEIICHLLATLV